MAVSGASTFSAPQARTHEGHHSLLQASLLDLRGRPPLLMPSSGLGDDGGGDGRPDRPGARAPGFMMAPLRGCPTHPQSDSVRGFVDEPVPGPSVMAWAPAAPTAWRREP